jgi:tripartite-type tricarboxylate transporter receptor subunit TctC
MVTNRQRSPLAPEVPTAEESGFAALTFEGVVGFYGWRDMPVSLRDQIAGDINAVGADPVIASRLRNSGVVVRVGTPAELVSSIEEQKAKVREVVAATKR